MGNKEIEKLLEEYRESLALKRELEIRVRENEEDQVGLKAVGYDSVGKSYGTSNPTEKQALNNDNLNRIKSAIKIIENKLLRVENLLSVLTKDERQIIELKHINDYSWENVCYTAQKSYKTCKLKERSAFSKMKNIINYKI